MCQIIYLSRLLTREYGASTNIVASLLFTLSKKGTECITATESYLAEKSGLSERFISKAKRTLKDHGYIEIVKQANSIYKGTSIALTKKLVSIFEESDNAQNANYNAYMANTIAQCANDAQESERTERTEGDLKAHDMQTSPHDIRSENAQHADEDRTTCGHNIKVIKTYKTKESNKNISREKNDDANHLDDDRNFEPSDEIGSSKSDGSQTRDQIERVPRNLLKRAYSAQEGAKSPLMSNYTQNANIVPSARSMNVLEGTNDGLATPKSAQAEKTTKKVQKSTVVYPQSVAEVLRLFQDWKDSHVQIEPRIQGVNLQLEAEAFFDYWSSQDWKRKGKPIKSIAGTVATWLMNSCTRVRGSYKAPANDVELAKEREMFERFSAQSFSFSPSQNHDPIFADAEVIDDNNKLLGGM